MLNSQQHVSLQPGAQHRVNNAPASIIVRSIPQSSISGTNRNFSYGNWLATFASIVNLHQNHSPILVKQHG